MTDFLIILGFIVGVVVAAGIGAPYVSVILVAMFCMWRAS